MERDENAAPKNSGNLKRIKQGFAEGGSANRWFGRAIFVLPRHPRCTVFLVVPISYRCSEGERESAGLRGCASTMVLYVGEFLRSSGLVARTSLSIRC